MRKRLLLLFFCAVTASTSIFSQTTYYWVGGTGTAASPGVFTTAANWNTNRDNPTLGTTRATATTTDILVFDGTNVGGLTPTTGNVFVMSSGSGTGTSACGQLKFIGATVTLSRTIASTGTTTIAVGGGVAGTDFLVDNTSTVTINSPANSVQLLLNIVTGNTGEVFGSITTSGTGTSSANSVRSADAQGLIFRSGSTFNYGTGTTGSVFGSINVATNNNVVFESGSTYYQTASSGSTPFGASAPASVVEFQNGSNFVFASGTAFSISSRYFGNVVIDANVSFTASPGRMQSLTINPTRTLTIGTTSGTFPITGNIVNNGTLTTTSTIAFLMCGNGAQSINIGAGSPTFKSLIVGANSNTTLASNFTVDATSTSSSNIYGTLNLSSFNISGIAGVGFVAKKIDSLLKTAATVTLGLNSITLTDGTGVGVGMLIEGAGIPTNTYITGGTSPNFTLSNFITAAGTSVAIKISNPTATVVTSNTGGLNTAIAGFGIYNLNNANYAFNGATVTPFPSSVTNITVADLSTTANVTLNANTTLTGALTVTASTLNTNGTLILASNANGTARIANSTGTITGNVTVQRFIPAGKRGFRFLSPAVNTTNFIKANWQEGATTSIADPSPLFGTHITGSTVDQTNGFDGTVTGNASLFQHNNATQLWNTGIANTDATNLLIGNAYRLFIRGNRSFDLTTTSATNTATTLRATGSVVTGAVTMNSTGIGATAGTPLLSANANGFSFIGNPYASPVSWGSVNAASTDLTGYYYIWDPTLATRGAYVSCFTNGVKSDPLSNITVDIQSGQAFFVQNKSSITAPVLVFQEAHKTAVNTNVYRTQENYASLSVRLMLATNVATNNAQDAATALFSTNYSNNVNDDDASKMTNLDENIAIQKGNKLMSIEQRSFPTANDTMQLKLWQLTQNNYVLRIAAKNFANSTNAFLKDNYLNTEVPINLTASTDVSFTTTGDVASMATDRFQILFRTAGTLPVNIAGIKAYQKNTGIQVDWNVANEIDVENYEVEKSTNGTVFAKQGSLKATGNNAYNWFDANAVTGNNYYRIKSISKNGMAQYSQIVNVKIGNGKNTFAIVANPVIGNTIMLQMEGVAKGIYTIKLFNQAGQLINISTINHAGGSATEAININNAAKGTYQLTITNADGLLVTKTILVN